jgi:hypothetical protein
VCETGAELRFRHLGHYFLKPGDSVDTSSVKVLLGLLNAYAEGFEENQKWSRCKGHCAVMNVS